MQALRQENSQLRQKLEALKSQSINSNKIDSEISKFVSQSEGNVVAMTDQVRQKGQNYNRQVHKLTLKYEGLLKKQIQLLTQNKDLSSKKQSQDQIFNDNVQQLTKEYQQKIKDFQKKVKGNVKKIQDLGSNNIIKRLLKSDKFRQAMAQKGINISTLQKQSQLQDISELVQARQEQINDEEAKSKNLDEQLGKMRQLIQTMKQLLENMVKQKENIVKQNVILKQKMKQSEQLIAKLLGAAAEEGQGEEYDDEQFEEDGDADEGEGGDKKQ